MVDVQGEITGILNAVSGLTAWRNRLPVDFTNNTPTAVVTVLDDSFHQSGATRGVLMQVRMWGGSPSLADARAVYDSVVAALSQQTTETISITGALVGVELPPEPEQGWPGWILRFSVRIKERQYGNVSGT